MKNAALGKSESEGDGPSEEVYKRHNTVQVKKVRWFVRQNKYLLNPSMEEIPHSSMNLKMKMSEDLIKLPSIAVENITNYIKAKIAGKTVKLTPVFVTREEEEEFCSIQNKTKDEIKVLIYKLIETLDKESAKLQCEVFEKTVKRKKKEDYIEFFQSLIEQIEGGDAEENGSTAQKNDDDV